MTKRELEERIKKLEEEVMELKRRPIKEIVEKHYYHCYNPNEYYNPYFYSPYDNSGTPLTGCITVS